MGVASALDWFGPWPVTLDALASYSVTRFLTRDAFPPMQDLRQRLDQRHADTRWGLIWTCPRCMSFWVAAGFVFAHTLTTAAAGDPGHRWFMLLVSVPLAMWGAVSLIADREPT